MNNRNILIALVTIAIVAVAWQTSREKAPTTELTTEYLYDGLVERVNDVERITVTSARATTELAKSGGDWVVANRDNFPATFATVKNTLLSVANATVVEAKTSKPERFAQLGVADIGENDGKTILLRVEAGDGAALASLLIGNERSGSQLNARQYYVRKTDSGPALLVEGELNVVDDPAQWMKTDVVNVATARVREVAIKPADGTEIVVSKDKPSDNFFTLANVPTGFTAKSRSIVSSLGAVLLDVKFENVAAAAKVRDLTPVSTAEIRTFDGLVATLQRYAYEGDSYVSFRFAFDADGVVEPETTESGKDGSPDDEARDEEPEVSIAEEVTALNEKTEDWIYRLPDYKNRMLEKLFDDLIKPVGEEKEKSDE